MSEKEKLILYEKISLLEEQVKAITWELARLRYKETHELTNRPEFMDAKDINFVAKFYAEPWPHVRFEEE